MFHIKLQGKSLLIFKYKYTLKCNDLAHRKVSRPRIRKGNLTPAYVSNNIIANPEQLIPKSH